jgi:hypothetical protein
MLGADWLDLLQLGWPQLCMPTAWTMPSGLLHGSGPGLPFSDRAHQTHPFCSRLFPPGDANKTVELLRYFLQETTPEQAYHLVSASSSRQCVSGISLPDSH